MADVINQSVKSLGIVRDLVKSNRQAGSQADIDFIPRVLRSLEDRLPVLKERESRLMAKLFRNLSFLEWEGLKAGNLQKIVPVQEYVSFVVDPDPDFLSTYAVNKLRRSHPYIVNLLKLRLKVSHDIKEVNSAINRYQRRLERTKRIINEQKSSPKKRDLKRDQIWNRAVSEILLLKGIHDQYKSRTRDPKGNEAYTEDAKVVNDLMKLQNKFVAFAERSPWVTSGRIVLDLSNPGSDTNGAELEGLLSSLKEIGYADKLDDVVDTYSTSLTKNINDPYVSKNLRRTEDLQLIPRPGDSLKQATSNFANFLELTQNADWYTNLSLKSQAEAVEKWFRGKVSKLYKNKPFCVAPPKTQEEIQREQATAEQQEVDTGATSDYQKRLDRAPEPVGVISEEMILRFRGKSDILDQFLLIPYRLSGSVRYGLRGSTIEYGIGIDYSTSPVTAKNRAESRALAALPPSGGKEAAVISTFSTSYQRSPESPIMTGIAAISQRQ